MTDLTQAQEHTQTQVIKSPVERQLGPSPPTATARAPSPDGAPVARRRRPDQPPVIEQDLRPTSSTTTERPPPRQTPPARDAAFPGLGPLIAPLGRSLRLGLGTLPWLFPLMGYIVPPALMVGFSYWGLFYLFPQAAQMAADVALGFPRGLIQASGGALGGVPPLLGVVWCALVGCERNRRMKSGVAKVVGARADQALDIFQSMIHLSAGDGVGLSLHPVEAWELATAIRYTTEIDDRIFISDTLSELGDGIRDVRDEVIDLNAQGLTAFTFIEHEFSRIEHLLTSPKSISSRELEKRVDRLFEKINVDLSDLLRSLEKTIPIATRASDLGRRVFGQLRLEESGLRKEREEKGAVGAFLGELTGWKGKQLRRDLELCRSSADQVSVLWTGLENTRTAFKQYQANVGQFKAGVIGFHAAGHGLTPEDEIATFSRVMSDFRSTLEEVRSRGRRRPQPSGRQLPERVGEKI